MKILITTPVLFDKMSSFNHLFRDLLESFLKDGHSITRIVACEECDNEEYSLGIVNENIDYVKVRRKQQEKQNIFMRYLADNITNFKMAFKMLTVKDVDVLFEDLSYASFWSVLIAKIKGIKIVLMVQDVWPDNAVQGNIIKGNSFLYKYFELLQKFVYINACQIICISDDIKVFLLEKGIKSEKISVIYNWASSEHCVKLSWEKNKFVKKYGLDRDKFYAVYAGNIGKMQNVEIVLQAALKLRKNDDIHFIIVGDGARKKHITKIVKEKNLKNVSLYPMQSSELALSIYSFAGVNIIPLVPGAIKTAFPSKTPVCLSCLKPVIMCIESDSKFGKVLRHFKAGHVVDPSDNKGLAECILNISKKGKMETSSMKTLFNKYFCRSKNLRLYCEIINHI